MILKLRIAVVVAVLAATVGLMVNSALAAGNSGSSQPGWGHGDKNHNHTGPPGQSNRP